MTSYVSEATTASLVARISAASKRPMGLGEVPAGAVSLAMGEPYAPTADFIVDEAVRALRAGRTTYAPPAGIPALRERIAHRLSGLTGAVVNSESVVVTHGGSGALASSILALVNPRDRVIVPEPTYSLYADQIAMAGAETVWSPPTAGGRMDIDSLRDLAPHARMMILCNPSNPTGLVLRPDEAAAVVEILKENPGLFLLSDEAYADIVFDDSVFVSALSFDDVRSQVITVGTFSKAYAMTGWRLGYAVSEAHAKSISIVHRTLAGPMNTFVQDAATAATLTSESELREQTFVYQAQRDLVFDRLRSIPGVEVNRPEGAFYAFPRMPIRCSTDEFVRLCANEGVLVRSGTEFGPSGTDHIRISFATDTSSINEGLTRLARALRQEQATR